jgi:nitroimidazol reductase NimA-like FMN-containing flavoprotein (pyridoxamine 5'-phosphate oxidase superfamily)
MLPTRSRSFVANFAITLEPDAFGRSAPESKVPCFIGRERDLRLYSRARRSTSVESTKGNTMTGYRDFDGWSPQGPVEELSDPSCWELLKLESFGRLAVSVDNQPQIFPVDFYTEGTDILFRTAAGTKLRDLTLNSSVAFEVDLKSKAESWSVVLDGVAREITDEAEIVAADRAPLPAWIPTAPYVYVRITPTSIRGRRFIHSLFGRRVNA